MDSLKSATAWVRSFSRSFWRRGFVKAVNCPPPHGKSTPVEHARCQLVIFRNGCEFIVKALQSCAVAFVVCPLNLDDEADDGVASWVKWPRRSGLGLRGRYDQGGEDDQNRSGQHKILLRLDLVGLDEVSGKKISKLADRPQRKAETQTSLELCERRLRMLAHYKLAEHLVRINGDE